MTIQESLVPPYADPQDRLYAERTRLLAEIEKLRAALEPFATIADLYPEDEWPKVDSWTMPIALSDLRRARAALSPPIEGPTG